ncbi:hypothetical protein M2347_003283 [Chryseobacterium sp. H1D6B]|uniref:PAAR-like protein n=1 Tax=Chryseobacterium sp. H1D6B TaxID=2940588 RepID=UPI0015CCFF8A|nr:PAAR-like protein [Chryseobacterium sp. H1D6B]MDH6253556.1 hypothetical protein [Chryseobacterium sp. H1D6B]
MTQLYIAQGTPFMCNKGRRLIGIGVTSQSSVNLKYGANLIATEDDRFKDNFICPEMVTAEALKGVAVVAAFSGGLLLLAAAAWAGSALTDDCLNTCSFLCKGSDWRHTHPKVKIENKKPLLQNSTLQCFIGGEISFYLPVAELKEASTASKIADDAYSDDYYIDKNKDGDKDEDESKVIDGYVRIDTNNQSELDRLFGAGELHPNDFDTNKDDGLFATLYNNEKTGDYFIAFRGSEAGDQFGKDWVDEDGKQALGIITPQIERTISLAQKVNASTKVKENKIDVNFTGHSLGGGNSAIASYITGRTGYTFNTRGIHQNTLNYLLEKKGIVGSTSNIINYSTSNDILNGLQNNREGVLFTLGLSYFPFSAIPALDLFRTGALPRALGEQHEIFGYTNDNEGLSITSLGHGHMDYKIAFEAMMDTININVLASNI